MVEPTPTNPFGEPMANRLLQKADQVLGVRAKDRDVEQERTMSKIVSTFNVATGHDLTEGDGWTFMLLLKLIRARTGGGFKDDDYIDMAAYAALLGESQAPAGA